MKSLLKISSFFFIREKTPELDDLCILSMKDFFLYEHIFRSERNLRKLNLMIGLKKT